MTRSTVREVLLFACFVVLVKIPEITTNTTARIPETSTTTNPRPLYAKDGFLMGEMTPVYYADFKYMNSRIRKGQTSVVLDAVNLWNSLKQNGSFFPIRFLRSVDDSEHFSNPEVLRAPWGARDGSFHSPRPVEKRSTVGNEVVYPSVLVVMNYHGLATNDSSNRTPYWLIEERVLYALSFWSTVDNSLRNIKNPRVSLRITGIVVIKDKTYSYLSWNSGAQTFDNALCPMMEFWRSLADKHPDFRIGSYDIVAHMTDILPRSSDDQCSTLSTQNNRILAAGTQGPPCNLPDKIAGFIIHDDFAFNGLHRAVGQMSKVLGGNEEAPLTRGWPRRNWNSETLDSISEALKHTTCMSAPKEHHPPGRPVAPIFAGEFFPSEKQCEVFGYGSNPATCWNSKLVDKRTSCHYLYCSKQHDSDDTCEQAGLTLDGTVCNAEKTKICLDGDCVDKV